MVDRAVQLVRPLKMCRPTIGETAVTEPISTSKMSSTGSGYMGWNGSDRSRPGMSCSLAYVL
jgi:hypothetical protein